MLLLSTTDVIFSMGEEPAEPKMYIVAAGRNRFLTSHGGPVAEKKPEYG